MVDAGIFDGDICVVDRSLMPADRSIVVVLVNGKITMKRSGCTGGPLAAAGDL